MSVNVATEACITAMLVAAILQLLMVVGYRGHQASWRVRGVLWFGFVVLFVRLYLATVHEWGRSWLGVAMYALVLAAMVFHSVHVWLDTGRPKGHGDESAGGA